MNIGIIGASGYTGAELLRILARHPEAEPAYMTAHTYEGKTVGELYPHLSSYASAVYAGFDADAAAAAASLHFIALPHGESMQVVPQLLERGCKVIDLSADYRLGSPATYEQWYGLEHGSPELMARAAYGLPELFRDGIASSDLIAVPGCYPTAVMMALGPLLALGLVEKNGLIADAKSGVSGAGRGLSLATHFAQCNENISPYGIGTHRHLPEMQLYLSRLAGSEVSLVFTPHLVPMNRGILATCYARLTRPLSTAELLQGVTDFFSGSSFVRVLPPGQLPQTKALAGSNSCQLSYVASPGNNTVVALSAIDNLVKGASGAAVQCMNIVSGFPEDAGLEKQGMFP